MKPLLCLSFSVPRLKMIIWVTGVLKRTIFGYRRFVNLCGNHLQTVKWSSFVSWKFKKPWWAIWLVNKFFFRCQQIFFWEQVWEKPVYSQELFTLNLIPSSVNAILDRVTSLLVLSNYELTCLNKVTYPTVVMETKAHQKPSHVPLVNDLGKFSSFLLFSCEYNRKWEVINWYCPINEVN